MPVYLGEKFKCPHCEVLAKQSWFNKYLNETVTKIYHNNYLDYRKHIGSYEETSIVNFINEMNQKFLKESDKILPSNLSCAKCQSCENFSIWFNKELVYPRSIPIELPNEDLNDDIKELYDEASKIFLDSPKGATALLRLALQKLLIQIGKKGKNINNDIKELVADGLNPKIQKALDLLRVIGNNAVHPGEINLDDNKDVALKLFKILNMITDEMITRPKEIDSLYDDIIPDETKNHIEKRDSKN